MALQALDSETITIDNYKSKLPRLDPKSSQLCALVDIGSNGIRFSISDLSEPGSRLLPCVYRERRGISLYDALHESGPDSRAFHFSPAVIAAVAQTLAHFRSISDRYGVPAQNINVFATEAMRTAQNRGKMLEAIQEASGLTVAILSPEIESLFGALGARSFYDQVEGLFIDMGGGSLQMGYLNSLDAGYEVLAARAAHSMPFGAARLIEAMSSSSQASYTTQELETIVKTTFDDLQSQFPKLKAQASSPEGVTLYLYGGGLRGFGYMLMNQHKVQPYPIPEIGGFTVCGSEFARTQAMLEANSQESKVFGMSKRRRQQFPAIALVVEALVKAIPRIERAIFCSSGNREGILYSRLPVSIRESNPLRLYPGQIEPNSKKSVGLLVNVLSRFLPNDIPSLFTPELVRYIVSISWIGMGSSDDENTKKSLHAPLSGVLAGLPGLIHSARAVLALTMCARWSSKLAPVDKPLFLSLRQLVGSTTSWWCEYVGIVVRLLTIVSPAPDGEFLSNKLMVDASSSKSLGKGGKKDGVRLIVRFEDVARAGVDTKELREMLENVGKGLEVQRRVEVTIS